MGFGRSVMEATIALLGKLDPSLKGAMEAGKKLAGETGKAMGKALAAGTAALASGTAALAAGAAAATGYLANMGNEWQKAYNQISAATGETGADLEGLKEVMQGVYANNFGEDVGEVAQAVADVRRQMSGLNNEDLQKVTESAFLLRDTFEYEVGESTRAAKALMDNFGVSGEEAMELIAAGAQNGLDWSGELLDTINEYSVQFAKVGLSADDMFRVMQNGADSGAWNLDKVGDAIGEFSKKAVDGSESTVEGFQQIGLNSKKMISAIAQGGDSARAAFQETVKALAAMDDPVKQNLAGLNLFGSMWEDLGPEVIQQLAGITGEAYSTGEALEQMGEVKYNDIGSALEGIKRKLEVALLPVANKAYNFVLDAIPMVEQALAGAQPYIEGLVNGVVDGANLIVPHIAKLAKTVFPMLQTAIQTAGPIVANIAQNVFPLVEKAIYAIRDGVSALVPHLTNIAQTVFPGVQKVVQDLTPHLMNIGQNVFPLIESAVSAVSGVVSALGPVFTVMWNAVKPVVDRFLTRLNELMKIATGVLDFIGKVGNVLGDVGGKIVDAGGKLINGIIGGGEVPAHATGGTFDVPHLAVVGDAPETIVPHGNSPRNRALLAEAAAGVGGGTPAGMGNVSVSFHVQITGGDAQSAYQGVLSAEEEAERRLTAFFERQRRVSFA